ncbi:MAG: hypothetical protein GY862_29395 [Gammaproteobacteria bacterium]|nr:hypothetical protein [Gammaproteobacteria bacterium]
MNTKFERLQVLLILQAQDTPDFSAVPSDEDLAAFAENRLRGRKRQGVLRYLRSNPAAYREWQNIMDALCFAPPPPIIRSKKAAFDIMWLKGWFGNLGMAGLSAVAVTLIAVLMIPIVLLQSTQTTDGYAIVTEKLKSDQALQQNLAGFNWPWEGEPIAVHAFSNQQTEEEKAFGAGLQAGQRELLNKQNQPAELSTDKSPYFDLGRLTVLLWTASQTRLPAEFWQTQQAELDELRKALAESSAFTGLNKGMQILMQHIAAADYAALQKGLEFLIDNYAPKAVEAAPL